MTEILDLKPFLSGNPPTAGLCDLYLLGPPSLAKLGTLSASLAAVCKGEQALVDHLFVLAPPEGPELPDRELSQAFSDACKRLELSGQTTFTVLRPTSFELDALLAAIPAVPEKSAIIVTYASRYRDRSRAPSLAAGAPTGDVWSYHLAILAEAFVRLARDRDCYILVDAGEQCPQGTADRERLLAVDDCAVVWAAPEPSAVSTVAARAAEWLERIGDGGIGGVVAEIDALDMPEVLKIRAKIQTLSKAGIHTLAHRLLRDELALDRTFEADVMLAYAQVALRARDGEMASDLIGKAIPGLETEEQLESALKIAESVSDGDNATIVVGILAGRYPRSAALLEHRLALASRSDDYREASRLLNAAPSPHAGRAAFYVWLAETTASGADLKALATHAKSHYEPFVADARIALARQAIHRKEWETAFEILLEDQDNRSLTHGEIRTLLSATEAMLQRAAHSAQTKEDVAAVVMATTRYLGVHPQEASVRARLNALMSVNVSGSLGLKAAVHALCMRLDEEAEPGPDPAEEGDLANDQDVASLTESVQRWLDVQPLMAVGRMTFPSELLPKNFNPRIGTGLARLVQNAGHALANKDDVDHLKVITAIGTALAPHTDERTLDLTLMRLAGGRLAMTGFRQQARDLIEGALEIAGPELERRRAAWFAYGDVYLRAGDHVEALLAFASGLSCRTPVKASAAWYETQSLISLMRDLHVTPIARRLVSRAEVIMDTIGNRQQYGHRLVTTGLQIEFEETTREAPLDRVRFAALLSGLARNCRDVLAAKDEPAPVAILLAQGMRLARKEAIELPGDGDTLVREAIGRLGEPLATQLRVVSAAAPAIADVQKLIAGIETARYADDVRHDVAHLAILARRFLDGPDAPTQDEATIFSLEILADQTIASYGEGGDLLAPMIPTDIATPLKLAKRMSRSGIAIVMLGLNTRSRLVRATFEEGRHCATIIEDEATFSTTAFRSWERRYPLQYGFERDENDDFLRTMEGLGISELPDQRTLLVADTALQSLPMNLLRVGDDFAAPRRAVAMAPSLTWLAQAEQRRDRRAGPSKAWIPKVAGSAPLATLDVMAERLSSCFDAHGIKLDTSVTIPADLAGGEIVVIGAHGGVHAPDNRYFRSLQDEEGENAFDAATLARAVEGAKVVILFVCSGGRVDAGLNTTSGLVPKLLNQGCSTVIGSPWPLNASVPPHWLPEFLTAWSNGVSAIDANAHAITAVRQALGYQASDRLAMHVYGDPLLRKMA